MYLKNNIWIVDFCTKLGKIDRVEGGENFGYGPLTLTLHKLLVQNRFAASIAESLQRNKESSAVLDSFG